MLLLVGQVGNDSGGEPSTLSSLLKLAFGIALLLVAARQWRMRPTGDVPAAMPKWMGAIDSISLGKALGLGFVLSAVNPKNLVMCLAAGTTIGAAHLSGGGDVVVVAVFTAIAASTVAAPVIGYLTARQHMTAPLNSLRDWLTQNNTAVTAVLLLVIGVTLVGKGIGGLSN